MANKNKAQQGPQQITKEPQQVKQVMKEPQ